MIRKNGAVKKKFKELRQKARQKPDNSHIQTIEVESMTVDDLRHYIEDLWVHQIELEIQNHELLQTQAKLEESSQKYEDLYDFAPLGYLTLNPDGKIMEANLTATKTMETPRKKLIGTLLDRYIVNKDRDRLNLHLRKLFRDNGRHTCEIRLAGKYPVVYLRLDSLREAGNEENKLCKTIMTDITERKQVEIALSRSESQLKQLSSKLIETQEKERKRIAYDLHDGVAQLLAASKLFAQNLASRFSDDSDEHRLLTRCIDINQKALTDLKRIVVDIRPTVLESMGIIAAIEWLSKQYQNNANSLTIVRKIDVQEDQISNEMKPVIFRILQEIMSNIVQHSQADQAEISLEKPDEILKFVVKDNGKGFELVDVLFQKNLQNAIGITSMTQRASATGGLLEILSSKTTGTTVIVTWPGPD